MHPNRHLHVSGTYSSPMLTGGTSNVALRALVYIERCPKRKNLKCDQGDQVTSSLNDNAKKATQM